MYPQTNTKPNDPTTDDIVYEDTNGMGIGPWHLPFLSQMPAKSFEDYKWRYYFDKAVTEGEKVPVYVVDTGVNPEVPVRIQHWRLKVNRMANLLSSNLTTSKRMESGKLSLSMSAKILSRKTAEIVTMTLKSFHHMIW